MNFSKIVSSLMAATHGTCADIKTFIGVYNPLLTYLYDLVWFKNFS